MFHGSFHLHTLVISTVVETEVMSLNALKSRGLGGLLCRIYENTPFKPNTVPAVKRGESNQASVSL